MTRVAHSEPVRIILDCGFGDLQTCLGLARHEVEHPAKNSWGYWSERDPMFTAFVRRNKRSITVRAERKDHDHG